MRPVNNKKTNLKSFCICFQKNCFCILLIYKTINLQRDTKQMLPVERGIKNDFICRCRYCTMDCKKKKEKRKYNCWWMFCSIIRTHQGFSVLKVLWFCFFIFIVKTIEMHYIMALFFFPHLLGKTEEECSFHSVTAQYLSRKWATEDTTNNAVFV